VCIYCVCDTWCVFVLCVSVADAKQTTVGISVWTRKNQVRSFVVPEVDDVSCIM
jgi:hypothetical protein